VHQVAGALAVHGRTAGCAATEVRILPRAPARAAHLRNRAEHQRQPRPSRFGQVLSCCWPPLIATVGALQHPRLRRVLLVKERTRQMTSHRTRVVSVAPPNWSATCFLSKHIQLHSRLAFRFVLPFSLRLLRIDFGGHHLLPLGCSHFSMPTIDRHYRKRNSVDTWPPAAAYRSAPTVSQHRIVCSHTVSHGHGPVVFEQFCASIGHVVHDLALHPFQPDGEVVICAAE